MPQFLVKLLRNSAAGLLAVVVFPCAELGSPVAAGGQEAPAATATRSRPDEKPEAFLERIYPGSRRSLDPRYSTGSGVFRAYFVNLADGRCVRAELETQFATLPGRSTASAFLELTEKPLLSPVAWKIAANAVGPVRLGMKAAAVRNACARYPVFTEATAVSRAGGLQRVLTVTHFGKRLLVAELAGEVVSRVEVLDPHLTTAQGVGAGASLAELAQQYGAGEALMAEAGLCLTFDAKCPGRGFSISRPAAPGADLSWSALLKANPRVRAVVVAGSPGAFAAETRATGLPRATRSRAGEAVQSFLKRAYPGCKSAHEMGRSASSGYPSYLVQLPAGIVHRAEVEPIATGGRGSRSGPFTLTSIELRTPFRWPITAGALGPIRLGMKRSQVEDVCEPYAVSLAPTTAAVEEKGATALAVTHFGVRLAVVELSPPHAVVGIRVLDPRWKTPQRAGVGTPLRELVRLYGTGELLIGESEVWVVFAQRCPGRSFCLAYPAPPDNGQPLWPVLLKANPRVRSVRVEAQ